MKTIQLDRDVYDYLVSKASTPGESVSATLRRELDVPEPEQTIELDDETYDFLLAKTIRIGESPSDILRRELHLDGTPPATPPDTPPVNPGDPIIFHIPAGTGTQPWNTKESAVQAKVGDTLRIVNDDSVAHRLHTDGNPFPHPAGDIPPGQSADFLLQTAFEGQPLFDHDAGLGAQFWITARSTP